MNPFKVAKLIDRLIPSYMEYVEINLYKITGTDSFWFKPFTRLSLEKWWYSDSELWSDTTWMDLKVNLALDYGLECEFLKEENRITIMRNYEN